MKIRIILNNEFWSLIFVNIKTDHLEFQIEVWNQFLDLRLKALSWKTAPYIVTFMLRLRGCSNKRANERIGV